MRPSWSSARLIKPHQDNDHNTLGYMDDLMGVWRASRSFLDYVRDSKPTSPHGPHGESDLSTPLVCAKLSPKDQHGTSSDVLRGNPSPAEIQRI